MTSRGSVVVIGNFDGVHRGHQAVLTQARAIADRVGHRCIVLTFHPHPKEVLGGGHLPPLMTLARRIELLETHGADAVEVQPFDLAFAAWTPEHFARELLAARLEARAVVVGDNFRFGAKRAGDLPRLRALGAGLGFSAVAADVAGDEKGPFSSTRVRDAVTCGDLAAAALVLGRPHSISGIVEVGDQLGRTLGFPTANLGGVSELCPPNGVYAVRVGDRGGVMNVGVRPTLEGTTLRIEAHLFDFDGDLYGSTLRVDFIARLREERKFAGLDALKAQIQKDVVAARAALDA